jgi:tetratricopeptide (TPR) repeat protein
MSIATQLAELRELRSQGKVGLYVTSACALAEQAPMHVGAQIEAAYACDGVGEEESALGYYRRAWQLGVPADQEARFVVGYGSTLRNTGHTDEAIAVLGEALLRHPDYPPIKAFLALALHSGKLHNAAMATLLELVLELGRNGQLDGFEPALADYQTELTTASLEQA